MCLGAPAKGRSSALPCAFAGSRTFDLNTDGVAHYGLFADLLADMQRRDHGGQALATLFRSAEAYLQMWRRAGEPR